MLGASDNHKTHCNIKAILQGAVVGVGRRIRLDEDSSSGLASLRTSELLLRIAGVRRNEAPRRNESPYSLRGHRRIAHA